MRREEKKQEGTIIEIEEEVRIPDTDIILEKGDKIRVIEASKKEQDDEEDDEEEKDEEPAEEKKKK